MKTATIFLVAVTVFTSLLLESSATPAESDWGSLSNGFEKIRSIPVELFDDIKAIIGGIAGDVKEEFDDAIKSLLSKVDGALGNSVKVDKTLKKFVNKSIEKTYKELTKLLQANEDALAKAAGDEKEVLNKIFKRLQNFDNIIRIIYTALESAVASGNSVCIKIVVFILSKAIDKTKSDQADIMQTLEKTPGEIVARFARVVKKEVDNIVAIAEDIDNKVDTFLSTRDLNA